jgi:TRAP-type C4-dicarboxylate transport system permease small subunit
MKALQKISDILDKACSWAIGILFGVMTVTYFLQVLLRYAFGTGFMWTEELTRYADIWAIMVGAAMIAKRKNWINVSVLEEMLNGRPRAKAALLVFQQVLTLIFFGAMFIIAFRFIQLAGTQVSTNMRIPKRWVYWIFPPAFAVAIYQTVVGILGGLQGLRQGKGARA